MVFFGTITLILAAISVVAPKPWRWPERPNPPNSEEILGEVAGRASGEKWATDHRGVPSQLQLDQVSGDKSEAWKRAFKRGFESGYKKADDGGTKPAF